MDLISIMNFSHFRQKFLSSLPEIFTNKNVEKLKQAFFSK